MSCDHRHHTTIPLRQAIVHNLYLTIEVTTRSGEVTHAKDLSITTAVMEP